MPKTLYGWDEDWETETSDGRLETGKSRVKDCAEFASLLVVVVSLEDINGRLQASDSGVENAKTETSDGGLETSESGVENGTERSGLTSLAEMISGMNQRVRRVNSHIGSITL